MPKELQACASSCALASSYYDDPMSVEETLRRAGIDAARRSPYGKLSGGQKRQAQFAVAICGRPKVLFLDEPTVGLDVQAREALWTSVRRLLADGCSIVLTTHYLEEAEALADRVTVITKGRVIATRQRRRHARAGGAPADQLRIALPLRRCARGLASSTSQRDAGRLQHHRHRRRGRGAPAARRRRRARRLEVRQAGLNEAFNELTTGGCMNALALKSIDTRRLRAAESRARRVPHGDAATS